MTVDRPFFKNGTPSALYFYSGTYSSAPDPSSLQTGTTAWFTDKPDANGGEFVVSGTSTPGTNIWDRVGGGYLTIDTWANILSNYAAATYPEGAKAFATDLNREVVIAGAAWTLVGNKTTTLSSSSGTLTLDMMSPFTRFEVTLSENITTWTCSGTVPSNLFLEKEVVFIQGNPTTYTVARPSDAKTAGGIAWVADTLAGSTEMVLVRKKSDGSISLYPTGRQV